MICFPLSDLFHSAWWSLGLSTTLQMTQLHSFLWLSKILLCVCTASSLPQSSADGHLGYFHVLAVVNRAAMKSYWIMFFFLGIFLVVGFLGHLVVFEKWVHPFFLGALVLIRDNLHLDGQRWGKSSFPINRPSSPFIFPQTVQKRHKRSGN